MQPIIEINAWTVLFLALVTGSGFTAGCNLYYWLEGKLKGLFNNLKTKTRVIKNHWKYKKLSK